MLRLLAALVVLAPLAGCPVPVAPSAEDAPAPTGGAERSPDLDAARERWQEAGFDAYQMTLQRSCFCPEDYRGPFEVTVRNGAVESATFNGTAVDAERVLTVADLFDLLEDAYDQGAARVDVTFDDELGYPTSLYIDYNEQMADEEVGYTVSSVQVAER